MNKYQSLDHGKYLVQYHLVWCPKFRFSILKGDIEQALKQILFDIAQKYKYEIIEMEVMPDHLHLFVSTKPTVAAIDVVRTFKSLTTIELFKKFSSLKNFYARCGSLWRKGYFVSTVDKVSAETIQKYIQEQKSSEDKY